ncbi:hypothetical protein Ppb6_03325 [Photorhabdus australis subsp. thailandensis]|uniref:Uncharacterized protein n=1 Tax=Photorhabdus australis subsp. thailandensis TaxID=2805096 RepID=A0A1C0U0N3_9GAMM|nr:hypothetical protein Ppb6_03325 [Photorhabdus australis subsp. thailandensis]
MRLIPDNQSPVADGGVRGGAVMALLIRARQPIDRQIIEQLTGCRFADADARTLLFNLKIRLILNIAKAQCAGVEGVFRFVGLARYYRAVQLGVVPDVNLIAPFAGKQPGLLLHRIIVTVQFVPAGIEA